ncbi:MAG TPA: fibrobacter succinogenes major paralogous domain-containing protein [Bacteroidales bacterium]|nr:fibrobacter succinogenes major paralogous domain-containing protein [Bacteroidales bacterium]
MKSKILKAFLVTGFLTIISNMSCEKDLLTDTETVNDIDGNTYKVARIGSQIWMAENLKTTRYNNGQTIGTTIPATKDIIDEIMPKYQWAYDGDEKNVAVYGRLYTWYAVIDSRNICPVGWHVPTNAEWDTLVKNIGGENLAGGKLKEKGIEHWASPNTGATNESGFTALPGGLRVRYNSMGEFHTIGGSGFWWSFISNGDNNYSSTNRCLEYNSSLLYSNRYYSAYNGNSVRCIKD